MKLKVIIVILFLFSYGAFYYVAEKTKNERIAISLDSHLSKLDIQYNTLIYHWRITSDGAHHSVSHNKKIINIMTEAKDANDKQKDILRKQLYKLMFNKYKALKTKGIYQLGFVLPDKTVLLRMHRPKKFGDNLKNKNYRVEYVTKFKKPIHGYEKGNITPAFRNAYPLFNNNGVYVGSMEVSFLSDRIQTYFSEVSKIHTHFLIHKDIINKKFINKDQLSLKYFKSLEHKDYIIKIPNTKYLETDIKNHTKKISPIKDIISSNIDKGKKFNMYTVYNNKSIVVTCYPIKNIDDTRVVAWIISYESDKFIDITLQNDFYIKVILFLFLLIIFYFIYINIKHKAYLELEVEKKTLDLKELNENLEQRIIIEVHKNDQIQKQLFKSEKLASMGDMIGNIAHQWRQPLSVISTASTGIKLQKEFNTITDEQLYKMCDVINDNAQYLSKTIDDFRNFVKGDRTKKVFNLRKDINSFLHLVEGSIKTHNIKLILDLQEDIEINGYENELIQCFINIFNNAKDILKEKVPNNKLLFITSNIKEDQVIVTIKDNAGGIPNEILPKIFEPYFTTKHKAQGTGLGLHMTYNLITDGMKGTIEAHNVNYKYNEEDYTGAEFVIMLPLS